MGGKISFHRKSGSTAATSAGVCKATEATMGLEDRLFIQGFMVMLSEGYRRLALAARVFEAVILLSRDEFTIVCLL